MERCDPQGCDLRTSEFAALRALVLENTGIALADTKRELVKRRFAPRLRALGLADFGAYVDYLKKNFDLECTHFCNAITTNLTSFYRETHHYDLIERTVLPGWQHAKGRLRLWSAGCSTGQEAYCMAMTVLAQIPDASQRDVRVLATDIDENCLVRAREGIYEQREFDRVPQSLISTHFEPDHLLVKNMRRTAWRANDRLKSLITFNKLNLVSGRWPMQGRFDVIFCRNVFIYFDKATQEKVLRSFAALQRPGAWLCLGHSETVAGAAALGYQLVGKTIYQRSVEVP